MNLIGKKLLVLTGCNGANDIINYSKRMGVYTIATDYYKESTAKNMADFHYDVSTTDIEGICEIANKHKIDGITTGASETSIHSIQIVSKRLGLPFYATYEQLETINDKKKFKDLLSEFDVPVPTIYQGSDIVEYPVIVKPVDSSGQKGITVCRDEADLVKAREFANKFSRTKKIIVEKYLEGLPEVFFVYTVVDGEFSLSCSFDNYKNREKCGFVSIAVLNLFPSKHLNKYINELHPRIVSAFKSIGIKNGVISVQTLFDGENFYVYEAGYRLEGTQSYIFIDILNKINHQEMMVNHALTGKMSVNHLVLEKENPFFVKPCCQRNIAIKPGTIASINGIEEVKKIRGVLNITEVHKIGDVIPKHKSKGETCLRIHIIGETYYDIEQILLKINSIIDVYDEEGESMLLEKTSIKDLKTNYDLLP